jgi:hypothetical protein
MDTNLTPSPDASSTDAAVSPEPPKRFGWLEGHMPEIVEPLDPRHPETVFTETRRLRSDGWTPDKKRIFLSRLAECGVVKEACFAAGMSARAAYNLRDRDPLFDAGWQAACVMARPRLADEAFSRSMNGVVERIYKDGVIVAERHRYDNKLTMAVLGRLDARIDRDQERGAPHLALVGRWDEYLAALGEDRREDGLALLAPPAPETATSDDLRTHAPDSELHELRGREELEMDDEDDENDRHILWEIEGRWLTDYPPPPGFDGEEQGEYGDRDYSRTLSDAEQAVIDEEEAEDRAVAEAQRDAYFGFVPEPPSDSEPDAQRHVGSRGVGDGRPTGTPPK